MPSAKSVTDSLPLPDSRGRFGSYGGCYVPETLMGPIEELESAYAEARVDPAFQAQLQELFHHYSGRPTALTPAGGCLNIWVGRESI